MPERQNPPDVLPQIPRELDLYIDKHSPLWRCIFAPIPEQDGSIEYHKWRIRLTIHTGLQLMKLGQQVGETKVDDTIGVCALSSQNILLTFLNSKEKSDIRIDDALYDLVNSARFFVALGSGIYIPNHIPHVLELTENKVPLICRHMGLPIDDEPARNLAIQIMSAGSDLLWVNNSKKHKLQ